MRRPRGSIGHSDRLSFARRKVGPSPVVLSPIRIGRKRSYLSRCVRSRAKFFRAPRLIRRPLLPTYFAIHYFAALAVYVGSISHTFVIHLAMDRERMVWEIRDRFISAIRELLRLRAARRKEFRDS